MRGFRGIDPRQFERVMKQYGMDVEEINDAHEVIIKTPDKQYVFRNPKVTMIGFKGEKTYQIIGEPEIISSSSEKVEEEKISDEDITLVMNNADVSYDEAKKAIEECNGNIAEAILKLQSK